MGLGASHDPDEAPLRTEGMLKYVRHPMYSGTILLVTGFLAFAPSSINAVTWLMMVGYIVVAIPFEEKKLVARYGEAYESYKQKVPALIPFKGKAL